MAPLSGWQRHAPHRLRAALTSSQASAAPFRSAAWSGELGVAHRVELRGWSAAMPIFNFLVVAAFALIALLFVAEATLEPGSPVIVTSQRSGLPEPRRPDVIQTLTTRPAPAPDMTSQAVLAAQPKSPPDALAKIDSVALAARATAPHKDKRVTGHQQTRFFERFSIKGY
jgi:hypothetical protein